ncbi:MFS transporter [Ornithinimicrobium faecis]|uniref:MFS transporter n=1 Tax=Ornithinimicrobium faecis TaxID=2934158 RepID=UPI002118968F|nr:MFS transporter [Ornithinimicrobium sp. HY1745]
MTEQTQPAWRSAPPYFVVTAVTTMMLVTGVNILTPILPAYARSFGISATEIGVVVGAFSLGRLLFDVVGGVLADRVGVRTVCLVGCLITGAASLGAGLSDTLTLLLAARFLQGLGSALYMSAATSLVMAFLPRDSAGRWLSLYHGIFLTGLAVGPLVGGVVADVLGLRAPFFAYAVMAGIGALLTATRLPTVAQQRNQHASHHRGQIVTDEGRLTTKTALRRLFSNLPFLFLLLVILVLFVMRAGMRNTTVPLFAGDVLGMGTSTIGVLITVGAVAQISLMWHAGQVLDRRGRRPVIVISLFATAAVVLLFTWATSPWRLLVVMVLLGVFTAYLTAAPNVVLVDVAPIEVRGTAIGVQRMATDLGQLAGPIVVGVVLDAASYTAVFLVTAGCLAVVALLSLFLPETAPRVDGRGAASTE